MRICIIHRRDHPHAVIYSDSRYLLKNGQWTESIYFNKYYQLSIGMSYEVGYKSFREAKMILSKFYPNLIRTEHNRDCGLEIQNSWDVKH